jgi:hypothetical protein
LTITFALVAKDDGTAQVPLLRGHQFENQAPMRAAVI